MKSFVGMEVTISECSSELPWEATIVAKRMIDGIRMYELIDGTGKTIYIARESINWIQPKANKLLQFSNAAPTLNVSGKDIENKA